jgi:hypothetical protein
VPGGLLLVASHCNNGDGKQGDNPRFIVHSGDFHWVLNLPFRLPIW